MTPRRLHYHETIIIYSCWLCGLSFLACTLPSSVTATDPNVVVAIPETTTSPFGSYPNLLNVTESEQVHFYPIIDVPKEIQAVVQDYSNAATLATAEEISQARRRNRWWHRSARYLVRVVVRRDTRRKGLTDRIRDNHQRDLWSIGKYDENRVGMYTSDLFQDTENQIDGYGGQRTVHLGIDLGAPAGTKVYAFSDGIVHSAGYNADFGDYGYVVVIEHLLGGWKESDEDDSNNRRVWALYGHLDKGSVRGKRPGKRIQKGQRIGRVGDCHENGGWVMPHVHFQLATSPPETHDMPGACSVEDRDNALLDYLDPRYIVGPVH